MKIYIGLIAALLMVGCDDSNPAAPTSNPGPVNTQTTPEVPEGIHQENCDVRNETTSWFSQEGRVVDIYNQSKCEQTYVLAVFRRLKSSDFYDQVLIELQQRDLPPEGRSTIETKAVTSEGCYQTDLYGGITAAQIESGVVQIHPSTKDAPNHVTPIKFYISINTEDCLPPPTPTPTPPIPPTPPVPPTPPTPPTPPIPPTSPCPVGSVGNVYWLVNSSATIDVGTQFIGNILALTSISLNTGSNLQGRALARNGAVTMTGATINSGGGTCLLPPEVNPYAVLAGTTVTCTGLSTINGDIGVSPGSAITGFPAPCTILGTQRIPPAADPAKLALTAAFTTIAGLPSQGTIGPDLSGLTLIPGIYTVTAGVSNLTGVLKLNFLGNPSSRFVFLMPSSLITSPGSVVQVIP